MKIYIKSKLYTIYNDTYILRYNQNIGTRKIDNTDIKPITALLLNKLTKNHEKMRNL